MADAATLPPSDAPLGDDANAVRPAGPDIDPIAIKDTALLGALYDAGEAVLALEAAKGLGRWDPKGKRWRSDAIRRSFKGFADQGLVTLTNEGEGAELTLKGRLIWEAMTGETPEPGPGGAMGVRHGLIDPDPDNARRTFDDAELVGLADDIAERGLLQNITLRVHPDQPGRFMLVAGERRWRAIGELIASGRWEADKPVPASVRDYAGPAEDVTFEAAIDALVENLVRVQLSPLEEARAFKRLCGEGLSTAALAARIKKTQRFVQQRLKLLELTAEDQAALDAGELTVEAARAKLAEPRAAGAGEQDSATLAQDALEAASVRDFWKPAFKGQSFTYIEGLTAFLSRAFGLDEDQAKITVARGVQAGALTFTGTSYALGWPLDRPDNPTPNLNHADIAPAPDDNASILRRGRARVLDALEELNRVVVTELTDPHAHNQTLSHLEKLADGLQAAATREGEKS